MQKVAAQQKQTHNQSEARPEGGAALERPQGEHAVQLAAMANSSPALTAQRQLADIIHNSPRQAVQRQFVEAIDNSPRAVAQRQFVEGINNSPYVIAQRAAAPASPNNTGLPDNLKFGIEALSGISMDDVRVHYNSSKPAQLNALAYAQGTDIHLAPGQEQHLPHEAWHVVQQAQGRVLPTMQMKEGVPVNDDQDLEREADVMGTQALHMSAPGHAIGSTVQAGMGSPTSIPRRPVPAGPIQAAGLKLLEDFNDSPLGEDDLPALYTLMQDIEISSSIDPDLDRVDKILTIFYKLSGGWETGLGDVLSPILEQHGDEAGVPASQITFGTVSDRQWNGMGRATKMTATLLTSNPGTHRGSDATGSRWAPYVEGHLLNHLLHGPAEPKNLAPFTRALNGIHSSNVEDPLKKMIYNEGRYFSYEVIVYPGSVGNSEEFIPSHITCQVTELDKSQHDQPLQGGYRLNATLTNEASASMSGTPSGKQPGEQEGLKLASGSSNLVVQELEKQFNALFIPWTQEYGLVIMEVLNAAYQAITAYEERRSSIRKLKGRTFKNEKFFLPKTRVTFEPTKKLGSSSSEETYNVATGMEAFPLTLRPGNTAGAEPESDRWWSPYLKGHLLNHHLHGPADERNLTPMTGSLNQQFENDVEDPLKEAVMTDGRVFKYTVRMADTPELDDIEPFAEEEDFFPCSLVYRVEEYKPIAGKSGSALEDISNWKMKGVFKKGTLYNTSKASISPGEETW